MIGKLKGDIDSIYEDHLIVTVNGVGYMVFVPVSVLGNLGEGENVTLHIETQVREDAITLFGFLELQQKKLFNLLKTVQGVGSKLALGIISRLSLNDLQNIIMLEDTKSMQSVPGVGSKVAMRIISELNGKIDKIFAEITTLKGLHNAINSANPNLAAGSASKEAKAALLALGYSQSEAKAALLYAISSTPDDDDIEIIGSEKVEDIIKKALNYFNEKNR